MSLNAVSIISLEVLMPWALLKTASTCYCRAIVRTDFRKASNPKRIMSGDGARVSMDTCSHSKALILSSPSTKYTYCPLVANAPVRRARVCTFIFRFCDYMEPLIIRYFTSNAFQRTVSTRVIYYDDLRNHQSLGLDAANVE